MAWNYLWIFLLVSAVCCCIGFKKYVYFLSVGYGFSVAGLGISYLIVAFSENMPRSPVTLVLCLLLILYGARLSGFLLVREIKNAGYRKVLKEVTREEKPMPFFVKFAIWISVAILYVAQTCPLFYRLYNGQGNESVLPLAGCIISIIGLVLESVSDHQKSVQKVANPHMVATQKLFKMVRCPNYFGEILFWTGIFVSGLNALRGAGQWILAVCGYVLIIMVMFNGAQRLDRRQEARYGEDPRYRAYADHTPILLPFIPLYHIGRYKASEQK